MATSRGLLRTGFDEPIVVLLGAGATRGAFSQERLPPPIDGEFFAAANQISRHGTPEIAKRVLRSVWTLYGRVEGVGLEEYYRDIETRARISKFAKTANKPKDWSKRTRDLEELIRRVYVETTTDEGKSGRRPRISTFHQSLLARLPKHSTIITFNYDLVIEEAFPDASIWNPRDGYGMVFPGTTSDWTRKWFRDRNSPPNVVSQVKLLKLHGSLGWGNYRSGAVKLKARPYSVRDGKFEKVSVLPPGWNKKIDVNPYKIFWREARLRLEQCSTLIVVGYSLPETDLLARALFAEAARMRVARDSFLKRLVLVDPNSDVRQKFVRLLNPTLGPTARVIHFPSVTEFQRVVLET
ncbi:MAG: SIR2 family protein [Burkholderiales bacterium]